MVNYVSSKDRADEVAEKCKGFGGKVAVVQAVSDDQTQSPAAVDLFDRTWESQQIAFD